MKKLITLTSLMLVTLTSINSFANFKVDVCKYGNELACSENNPSGDPDFSAQFETQEEADSWIAEQENSIAENRTSWGLIERLVPLENASDEDRALAIEVIPEDEENKTPSMLKLRKMYSRITRDISSKVALERSERLAKIQERQEAKERLKDLCEGIDGATTIAGLKAAVKTCIRDVIRATRE